MKFSLPLPPSGVNHAYATSGGRWYKVKKLHDWEEDCLWQLKGKITPQIGPVALRIIFVDGDRRKHDVDSRIKFVLDLLEKATLYPDDNMVNKLHVYKKYDKNDPHVEIKVC